MSNVLHQCYWNTVHTSVLLWLLIDVFSCPFRMAHTWLSYCSQKATRWVNKAVKHHPQHRFNSSDTLDVEMIETYICQEIQTDSNIPSISYIQYACGMCVWTHKARKDWLISHPDESFYPKVTLLTGKRLLLQSNRSKVTNFHLPVCLQEHKSTARRWIHRSTSCLGAEKSV